MAIAETPTGQKVTVKEMSWDPVTRIVGSLGIHTEIDFTNQQVLKCWSTSSLFRGFDIFMKGIDPRDAHFITSRICGICGDNHCTCSCLNQNMAYSVKPPKLGDFAFNLAESADFMFDHAIYNDCMANVDYSEQMVKETNPAVLAKAEKTAAPHADIHGYKTIADIMRALNAFTGDFYLETLQVSRYTREMYCLFGGRHTHPSTILPGGCSANITQQTCTEYYVRLMRYIDYCKRTVPMHDDLYDFFYEALPGYERVGFRETDLICWGCFDDPDYTDYRYATMTEWGRHRYVTPGLVFGGELITTDLVEINLAIRILLGSSYFDDWSARGDVRHPGPARQRRRQAPPVEQGDAAQAAGARLRRQVLVGRVAAHARQARRPLRRQRHRRRPVRAPVGHGEGRPRRLRLPEGDRREPPDGAPEDGLHARDGARVEDPAVVERDRAPARAVATTRPTPRWSALHNLERAQAEIRAGRTKSWNDFTVPEETISVGFHEAARGVLSHHMVIREGKIANYQPYPPTPWNGNPRDFHGTPGPVRGRGAEHADLRGERPGELQGGRHHAGGPLVRPVPALRRAHVRQGQGPQGGAHADRDVLSWRSRSAPPRRSWSPGSRR